MTRETKVGLVVGMGVILLIGIIVSDHLSVMQQQEPAAFVDNGSRQREKIPPGSGVFSNPGSAAQQSSRVGIHKAPSGSTKGLQESPYPLPSRHQASPRVAPPVTPRTDRYSQPVIADPAAQPVPPSSNPRSSDPVNTPRLAAHSGNRIPPLGRTNLTPDSAGRRSPSHPTQINQPPASRNAAAATPRHLEPVIHYVQPGESLWQIAQRYYDDGESWRVIAAANEGVVHPDGQVRGGVRLVIPNKASTSQPPHPAPAASGGGNLSRQRPSDNARVSSPTSTKDVTTTVDRTIQVDPGDNLSTLADRHLGSTTRWRELFEANRDQLAEPDQVRAGMTLRMPGGRATAPHRSPKQPSHKQHDRNRSEAPRIYVVQTADTLSSIAQRLLGDRSRWREIYQANQDHLSSPDAIRSGQELTIPPR